MHLTLSTEGRDQRLADVAGQARALTGSDVAAMLRWAVGIGAEAALPASGATAAAGRCWRRSAAQDLTVARVLEPHLDALAILAEAGQEPAPSSTWGVWAAEGPGARLGARRRRRTGWVLTGRKPWCSLAGVGQPRPWSPPGSATTSGGCSPSTWPTRGSPVEDGTWVPRRAGRRRHHAGHARRGSRRSRWARPAGTSSVTASGGAGSASRRSGTAVRSGSPGGSPTHAAAREPDQLALMHLGEVDAALAARRAALAEAADAGRRRSRHRSRARRCSPPACATSSPPPSRMVGTARRPRPGAGTAEPGARARRAGRRPRALRAPAPRRARRRRPGPDAARGRRRSAPVVTFTARSAAGTARRGVGRTPALRGPAAGAISTGEVDTVVVVAAHPDDESLGAGGLLARAAPGRAARSRGGGHRR